MKPVAVLYATREGQTRKIAERVAGHLAEIGYESKTLNVGDDDAIETLDLNDYSGAILAASVHAGEHGREMIRFVKAHVSDLNRIPNCFISVTLTQASVDMPQGSQRDHEIAVAAVKQVMDTFFIETGGLPIRLMVWQAHCSIPSTIRWFAWCLSALPRKPEAQRIRREIMNIPIGLHSRGLSRISPGSYRKLLTRDPLTETSVACRYYHRSA